MDAHQRLIALEKTLSEPRVRIESLAGCKVEFISRREAGRLILEYEWLGNLGTSTIFVGLVSAGPAPELYGVACFGYGPLAGNRTRGGIRERLGGPAWCLERGACVHYAPKNAASFLINAACKLVARHTKVSIYFAYADPEAGEYGGVYQAAGWVYLGQGLNRKINRRLRTKFLAPGKDPAKLTNWQSTRALRQGKRHLTYESAKALGWQRKEVGAKHVYATCVAGPLERKAWRKAFGLGLPYPSPRPELKAKLPSQ